MLTITHRGTFLEKIIFGYYPGLGGILEVGRTVCKVAPFAYRQTYLESKPAVLETSIFGIRIGTSKSLPLKFCIGL